MDDLARRRSQVAARESRWQRTIRPHSYDPATGATYVRWFWHPIHVRALVNRLRWRYMAWQQRHS